MKKIAVVLLVLLATSSWAGSDPVHFVKLDKNGHPLPMDAAQWSMVQDKSSGLTWEVKRSDSSIHNKDKLYGWDEAMESFIAVLNKEKFGGFSDWRMPTLDEYSTIREKKNTPHTNTDFFPNTAPSKYWSYYICGDGSFLTKKIKFGKERSKGKGTRVRAVRGGDTVPVQQEQ